jgi:hypothetical protein
MNSESNDFVQLRRALALKRHEAPPPRYFNEFSSRVIARLTAEPETVSWWQRLVRHFDVQPLQPALMCGVGVVICGLLSFGVISAMQLTGPTPAAFQSSLAMNPGISTSLAPMARPVDSGASIAPLIAKQTASPFNQFTLRATTVGFNSTAFGN